MILINILLLLLVFLIISDLCIKNSPKSKLILVPVNYKVKRKDSINELIIDLKIIKSVVFSFSDDTKLKIDDIKLIK